MKYWAALLSVCLFAICTSAQRDAAAADVLIAGNDFVSQSLPKMRVVLDPELKYIGSFPFDIDGIAGGHRFVWGAVDHDKHLRRTFIIQKEGFHPGSGKLYRYATPNPVTLGQHVYQHNVFITDNEQEAREHPGHEPDVTNKFLRENGYGWDSQLVMSRFARIVDDAKEHEIILFYAENLKDYTNRNAADLAKDAAGEDQKRTKELVNSNSMRAFKVID